MKKSTKKVSIKKNLWSQPMLVVVALVGFAAVGVLFLTRSDAAPASKVTGSASFTPVDGTWPTAVLQDKAFVQGGVYGLGSGGYYGPVVRVNSNFKGIGGSTEVKGNIYCVQDGQPIQFVYDSNLNSWQYDSGKTIMNIGINAPSVPFENGQQQYDLPIYMIQSPVDPAKPMNCTAQVYVVGKVNGLTKIVNVPVTQKFILQPK